MLVIFPFYRMCRHFDAVFLFTCFFFFFLMIRRPPRSTLFPYTRSSDLGGTKHAAIIVRLASKCATGMKFQSNADNDCVNAALAMGFGAPNDILSDAAGYEVPHAQRTLQFP